MRHMQLTALALTRIVKARALEIGFDRVAVGHVGALQHAAEFQRRFKLTGIKLDAQIMATALNVYVTTSGLAGTTASSYGFSVSAAGLGKTLEQPALFRFFEDLIFRVPLHRDHEATVWLLQSLDGTVVRVTG